MSDELDIEQVEATVESQGSGVRTISAVQALLKSRNGTPIVPFINNATLDQEGIIKPDGVTVQTVNGVLSVIGGGGSSSDGSGIPPSNCKNLTISKSGLTYSLKWQDPDDTIIDKQTLSSWGMTKIVRKLNSFPENIDDGDLICTNSVKNAHFETALTDTVEDSGDYYYKAFPISLNGAINYNAKNNFTEAIIYEFCINPSESNPALRVTYPAGCTNENFTPAKMNFGNGFDYGDWEHAFFQPRPVMVKSNGQVDYELYKPDFRFKADGVTASDVANTNYDGNAMIGFPQVWFKFEMDGTLQHVYVANKQVDENYHCYTHINKNGVLLDEIFIMAFQPGNVSNKLRSLSGLSIMTGQSGTTEMTYAQANGSSWNIMDYGEFNMIAMLLTLMGKSTNVEAVYGCGRYSSANATTGECIADGMFYGTNANGKLKIFGIENYYSNYWKRCNGCVYNTTDGMKYKLCDYTTDGSTVIGYNTTGEGYLKHQTFSGSSGGYISQMLLTDKGIFPTVASGSATTYFCDGLWWANGGFAIVGGDCGDGSLCGAFCLLLYYAVSHSQGDIGGSLSCKPL